MVILKITKNHLNEDRLISICLPEIDIIAYKSWEQTDVPLNVAFPYISEIEELILRRISPEDILF